MKEIQEKLINLAKKDPNFLTKGLRATARELGIAHPQTLKFYLEKLVNLGLIKIDEYQFVTVCASVSDGFFLKIPILGRANCGLPEFFAEENYENFLLLSKSVIDWKKSLVAIKTIGNSMNKADINGYSISDGDMVIVDRSFIDKSQMSDGDYVLSSINDMINIKKYFFDKKQNLIVLKSESTNEYPPIVISCKDSYKFCGKVIKVIKK